MLEENKDTRTVFMKKTFEIYEVALTMSCDINPLRPSDEYVPL